jgi:ribosomal protein L37AE/L43A
VLPEGTELHPLWRDQIESERCPRCGEPGYMSDRFGPVQVWRCSTCDDTEGAA